MGMKMCVCVCVCLFDWGGGGTEAGSLIDLLHLNSYLLQLCLLSTEVHTATERTEERCG